MESAIKNELETAKNGDLSPLLGVLKDVKPGQKPWNPAEDADGYGEPVDQRWSDVEAAWFDDELSDDQMNQCRETVGLPKMPESP